MVQKYLIFPMAVQEADTPELQQTIEEWLEVLAVEHTDLRTNLPIMEHHCTNTLKIAREFA